MIYIVYIALAIVAFLIMLNGFLRGAKKAQLDAVLSILLLGLIVASFFVEGWKFGLIAIGLALMSALVARPLAARVASKIFSLSSGGSDGGYVGLPPKPLERISQELGCQLYPEKIVEEMLSGSDRRERAMEALLDFCEAQPGIQRIMSEFQISRNDLKGLYYQLIELGAGQWRCGHWVAASSIAYPKSLQYLLGRRDVDKIETAYNLLMYFERETPLKVYETNHQD